MERNKIVLKRKITTKLLSWKNKENKKCLLIKGPRQIGKTFVVRQFGKEHYQNFVEINFIKEPKMIELFKTTKVVDEIIEFITINKPNSHFEPKKTLLFLDEIQECPEARAALKFFTIDKLFDVIASGSLMGIQYKNSKISYPVGYIEVPLKMNSLDFEEFLWAFNIEFDAQKYLSDFIDNKKTIPNTKHSTIIDHMKKFIIVGGMPEAVIDFVLTKDYNKVRDTQIAIVEEYKNDIIKYSTSRIEQRKITECFNSIYIQLSKENKTFKLSSLSKSARTRNYMGALQWLIDADIIDICYNLKTPIAPLSVQVDQSNFKIYMKDTGLLVSMLERSAAAQIIDGDLGIYKGAIYENLFAEILTKNNIKLYFHRFYLSDNKRYEIDFVLAKDKQVTLLEVKAKNSKSKSLNKALEKYKGAKGIKFVSGNFGGNEKFITMPFYMALLLKGFND